MVILINQIGQKIGQPKKKFFLNNSICKNENENNK